MYDVAVIGGGPVGSRVAYQLAGAGYALVVVEQKKRLDEPVCCTGIISQECASSFGIDEGVIFRRAKGARFFSPSGKLLSLYRQEPQACIVDRPALNMALAKQAQGEGADYVLDCLVKDITVSNNRVELKMSYQGEGREYLEARVVVIATGFGSRLVERAGLGKSGDFISGAQAEVKTKGIDEVEVYFGQNIAPGFFGWLVPTSPRKALVGLLSRQRPAAYLRGLMSSLSTQGKIAPADVEFSYGAVPLKPLPRSYSDRVLVVGTAAGQVKPTTGGGIYYGLLCADMAASKLDQALKRDALLAKDLSDYERAWRKKLGRELRTGYWARRFYETLSDRQIDRLFDIIKSSGIARAIVEADDFSFDWHGRLILNMLGNQVLSEAVKVLKIPFSLKGRFG